MRWQRVATLPFLTLLAVVALPPGEPRGRAAEPVPAVEQVAVPQPSEAVSTVATVGPLEVQCGAARTSSVGNLLDAKRAAVTGPRRTRLHARAAHEASVRRLVLAHAAEEARNRDAGQALEAYWSLAEAEHSLPELRAAAAAVDAALADQATLAERGIDLPLDVAPLRGRRLSIEDAEITATAAVDTLSLAVSTLAGLPSGPVGTVHPATGRAAVDDPVDVEALVAEGLARRPELRMLRAMLANLDDHTAAVGAMVLGLVSPALGGDEGQRDRGRRDACRLHHAGNHGDTASIRRQLQRLLRDRESAVDLEIRQAARLVTASAERVANAEGQRAVAEQAAADKRAQQPVGDADAFAVHLAEAEAAAARRGVIERLATWERSRTKLWQAQGVLAGPCGCRR